MTTLIPTSQPTGVEAYEDMFKEITRKLYGEETGHGLHTLGTPVAHVATGGPTVPEGERSFTTLLSDRSLTSIDYDHNAGTESNNLFKNDEHLTAFGLALMQNGFPPHGAILNSHTFQQMNKQQQQQQHQQHSQQQQQQQQSQLSNASSSISASGNNSIGQSSSNEPVEEKWTPQHHNDNLSTWNAKTPSYQSTQKLFKIKKQEIIDTNNLLTNTNVNTSTSSSSSASSTVKTQTNTNNTTNSIIPSAQKRYNCTNCPYSTDRRDLFTRHENIHKEEKPFHCYVCLKQFNRADHVKKHFLRMHRGLVYDISRTKRTVPQQQANKKTTLNTNYFSQQSHQPTTLNIPTAYSSTQHQQTQQQQQQQQQQPQPQPQSQQSGQSLPAIQSNQQITLKQEKTDVKSPKKKGDKRFVCCYCTWSGSDNWGLKRHLNTHTKPYVCMLCDYKAARSERLATHVFKVHNKKVCTKCNYLADTQDDYDAHVYEAHAHEARSHRNNQNSSTETTTNVLRSINNTFNVPNSQLNTLHGASSASHVFGQQSITSNWRSLTGSSVESTATSGSSVGGGSGTSNSNGNSSGNQKTGAERLFQYMEADGSDPEDYTRQMQMAALSRNTASVAQDFHNAGGGDKKLIISKTLTEDQIKQMIINHMKTASNQLSLTAATLNNNNDSVSKLSTPIIPNIVEQIVVATSKTMNKNVSPPALNLSTNKRRKSSTQEKENENIFLKLSNDQGNFSQRKYQNSYEMDDMKSVKLTANSLKQGFDTYIRATTVTNSPPKSSFAFNRNASFNSVKESNGMEIVTKDDNMQLSENEVFIDTWDSSLSSFKSEKCREQAQPTGCIDGSHSTFDSSGNQSSNKIDTLRDKHLNLMVSKKMECGLCKKNKSCMVLPYHTTVSLMLHKLWRHSQQRFICKKCGRSFNKNYTFKLHLRPKHRHCKGIPLN